MRICVIAYLLGLKLIFTTGILEADKPGELKWSLKTGFSALKRVSEPAIGLDGIIYFSTQGSWGGSVYGVNGKSGSKIWEHSHAKSGTFISSPSVGTDGTVYFTAMYDSYNSPNRGLYALNGWTGARVWEFTPEEEEIMTYSPPVIGAENTIYFLAKTYNYDPNWGTYTLYAIDGKTGKSIWKVPSESSVVGLGFENDIYHINKQLCLAVIDAKTGIKKRELPDMPFSGKIPPVIDSDGTMYITGGDNIYLSDDKLIASDVKTGKKLWEFEESVLSPPIIDKEGRLYATNSKTLYSINKKTGKKLWEFKSGELIYSIDTHRTSSPAISSDGAIYIGSGKYFFALDSESGEQLWEFDTSWARPTSPAIGSDGTIYFGSDLGLYAFHGKSGPGLAPWPMFGQNPQRTHKASDTGKFPEYFTIQVDGNGGTIIGGGTHRESDRIELKATAGQGNVFTGWSGDLEGDINPMEVEINSDFNITANFSRSTINIPPDAGDVIELISPDDATVGSTEWNWAAESKNILATSTSKGTNLYEVGVDGSVYYLSSIPVAPDGYGQCLSFSENFLVIGREREAAYVYKIKSDQSPKFLAKLVGSKVEKAIDNSTSVAPGWFARNVILSGNLLAISEHGEGTVYLYRISDDESVVFLGKVYPPSGSNQSRFGESMSLFGDLMAVSTYSFGNPPTSETFLFRINFDGEVTFLNSVKGIGNGGSIALSADFLAIRYDNLGVGKKAIIYKFDEDGSVISTQEITDLSGDEFTYLESISFQNNHLLIPPQIFELKSDGSFKPIDSGETNGFNKIANHNNSLGYNRSYYAFGTNFLAASGEVYFDPSLAKTVTISTASLPYSGGSVSGGGEVFEGWDVTLKAKPSGMNKFIGWTGDFTGKDNPLTIKADKGKTLIANFAMTYEVIITSTSGGEVTGGGFIPENESTTLHAIPDLGYRFNGWSGDIKDESNPLTITVDSAKTINASFIKDDADDDGDGLSNYSELITYQTSPDKKDTDGDWLTDKEEIEIGTDPKSSNAKLVEFIKEKLGSDMDHLHAQGMEEGINLVKSEPETYKLFTEADINSTRINAYSEGELFGVSKGKNLVINDPSSYGMISQAEYDQAMIDANKSSTSEIDEAKSASFELGIIQGRQSVLNDPPAFRLVNRSLYDELLEAFDRKGTYAEGLEEGINLVKSEPETYKLFTEADINSTRINAYSEGELFGVSKGKNLVINDPSSYGMISQVEYDQALDDAAESSLLALDKANSSSFDLGIIEGKKRVLDEPVAFNLVSRKSYDAMLESLNNKGSYTDGLDAGISLVTSTPRTYKLFSESDINSTRANAYSDGQSEGYQMGKQSVLNDPTSFNLVTKESLNEIFANVDSTATPYTQEWFFIPDQGWFWTKKNVFPYIYSKEQNSWLYFKSGNEKPLFYDYQEMAWQVFE